MDLFKINLIPIKNEVKFETDYSNMMEFTKKINFFLFCHGEYF